MGKWQGQFISKGLILQAISDKLLCKKLKNQHNGTRPDNFDIYLCISFDHYCQKLSFRHDTGQSVSPSNFKIFFSFLFIQVIQQLIRLLMYIFIFIILILRLIYTHTEFIVLDIKYRFNCSELSCHRKTLNCKDIMSLILLKKNFVL